MKHLFQVILLYLPFRIFPKTIFLYHMGASNSIIFTTQKVTATNSNIHIFRIWPVIFSHLLLFFCILIVVWQFSQAMDIFAKGRYPKFVF